MPKSRARTHEFADWLNKPLLGTSHKVSTRVSKEDADVVSREGIGIPGQGIGVGSPCWGSTKSGQAMGRVGCGVCESPGHLLPMSLIHPLSDQLPEPHPGFLEPAGIHRHKERCCGQRGSAEQETGSRPWRVGRCGQVLCENQDSKLNCGNATRWGHPPWEKV